LRLLVVEDDKDLNRQLVAALGDAGYAVDTAFDGEEGHFLGDTEPYDAVVLDLGLPTLDGVSVLRRWRDEGRNMPVLILTAREAWSEKVAGFDAGAFHVPYPKMVRQTVAHLGEVFGWSAAAAEAFWSEKVEPTLTWNRLTGNADPARVDWTTWTALDPEGTPRTRDMLMPAKKADDAAATPEAPKVATPMSPELMKALAAWMKRKCPEAPPKKQVSG